MDIKNHNKLIKMSLGHNKHLNHVMTSGEIRKVTAIENSYPLTRMPVCNHCEKLAYWNHGGAWCPSCGTYTKTPITYSSYLASGFDIETGTGTKVGIAKRMMELNKRKKILPDYGE